MQNLIATQNHLCRHSVRRQTNKLVDIISLSLLMIYQFKFGTYDTILIFLCDRNIDLLKIFVSSAWFESKISKNYFFCNRFYFNFNLNSVFSFFVKLKFDLLHDRSLTIYNLMDQYLPGLFGTKFNCLKDPLSCRVSRNVCKKNFAINEIIITISYKSQNTIVGQTMAGSFWKNVIRLGL